jgi:predicted peptidase
MNAGTCGVGSWTRTLGVVALVLVAAWSEADAQGGKGKGSGKKPPDPAKGVKHGFVKHEFQGAIYQVFVPKHYDGKKAFPTILFLHGSGSRGTDGDKPTHEGLGKAIRHRLQDKKDFNFLAVFPQTQGNWHANSPDGERAAAILTVVEQLYKVDPNRVYLTGLSLGGIGTWSLAAAYPQKWAAIVPVSGIGPRIGEIDKKTGLPAKKDGNNDVDVLDMTAVERVKNIPTWVFHSKADEGIPFHHSADMVRALEKLGAKPKHTWFDRYSHAETFDHVYIGTPQVYDWMLKHKR